MIKIAPSILSADFSRLGEEVRRIEDAGADWVHVDVMDGNFVPNITIGPVVIGHVRSCCSLPFDVHLMIAAPERFVGAFSEAGADIITVHVESTGALEATLRHIRSLGKKVGLSLNPATPFSAVVPHMGLIDLLLIMTVQPGFAGQQFMHEVLPKIAEARKYVDDQGLGVEIEVDGGINKATGRLAVRSGATILAAGSALFSAGDLKAEIADWKRLR